ncbi:MAG: fumarylacetoacetate hydrolase family protein [Candidatus Latescibacterota bacterium]|nr:MAG: fumarylacetoacetate hydrolase family protein [Candidatus Latescibacterota bacterium]
MKIVSFGPSGQEKPGIVHHNHVIDVCAVDPSLPDTVRGILDADALPRLGELLKKADTLPPQHRKRRDGLRIGPPVTNPSKIVCIGLNYKDHAEEQNRKPPDWPLTFAKGPNVLIGDGEPIPLPHGVTQLDHEVELAAVVGRRAKNVPLDDAKEYVAGYSVFMDISARDVQYKEKQWFRAKSFDGFGPFGPWLTTCDEVPDPHRLDIKLDVNGETRQASNTRHMIFDVFFLVHYLSQSMTLEPGDIISTGTPSGVGVFATPPRFLRPGDALKATIESLGTLNNVVV